MANFATAFTSDVSGCEISSCVLKKDSCSVVYERTNIALVDKFKVMGVQSLAAGFINSNVCVYCTDNRNKNAAAKNLTFKATGESGAWQLTAEFS